MKNHHHHEDDRNLNYSISLIIIMNDYVNALITIHELKTMAKSLQHESYNDVMQSKMNFIHKNNTWAH